MKPGNTLNCKSRGVDSFFLQETNSFFQKRLSCILTQVHTCFLGFCFPQELSLKLCILPKKSGKQQTNHLLGNNFFYSFIVTGWLVVRKSTFKVYSVEVSKIGTDPWLPIFERTVQWRSHNFKTFETRRKLWVRKHWVFSLKEMFHSRKMLMVYAKSE